MKSWKCQAWGALCLLLLLACRSEAPRQEVGPGGLPVPQVQALEGQQARFQEVVAVLCAPEMEGRDAGTAGLHKACLYLLGELEQLGLRPAFEGGWLQPLTVDLSRGVYFPWREKAKVQTEARFKHVPGSLPEGTSARAHGKRVTVWNVGGILPGQGVLANELIVLGAHYDHIGMGEVGSRDKRVRAGERALHPGADDNASGVAATLLATQMLLDAMAADPLSPRRTVVVVFFAAEERGMHGSTWFVRHLEQLRCASDEVAGMICPDMVGRVRSGRLDAFELKSEGADDAYAQAARQAGLAVAGQGLKVSLGRKAPGFSDNLPFQKQGVRAILVSSGLHPEFHTPRDTPDRLNPRGGVLAGRFLAAWTGELAGLQVDWAHGFAMAGENRGLRK